MNKFYDTLTNTRGDVLPNYRAQVVNPNGTVVDIFADRSGTPFTDANGGTVNYATADSEGLIEFYWEAATGQIFQMLDPAGDLVKVVEGFADNYVIDNFSGSLPIDRVVDLGDELLALNEGVAAAATTAALASPEGAEMVAWLSAIVDASTRSVGNKLREVPISPADAGATGDDATDDQAFVQSALLGASLVGLPLRFQSKHYIAGSLSLTGQKLNWTFDEEAALRFNQQGADTITLTNCSGIIRDIAIEDDRNTAGSTYCTLLLKNCRDLIIERPRLTRGKNLVIAMVDCDNCHIIGGWAEQDAGNLNGYPVWMAGCSNSTVSKLRVTNCTFGLVMVGPQYKSLGRPDLMTSRPFYETMGNRFVDCEVVNHTGHAFDMMGTVGCGIENCDARNYIGTDGNPAFQVKAATNLPSELADDAYANWVSNCTAYDQVCGFNAQEGAYVNFRNNSAIRCKRNGLYLNSTKYVTVDGLFVKDWGLDLATYPPLAGATTCAAVDVLAGCPGARILNVRCELSDASNPNLASLALVALRTGNGFVDHLSYIQNGVTDSINAGIIVAGSYCRIGKDVRLGLTNFYVNSAIVDTSNNTEYPLTFSGEFDLSAAGKFNFGSWPQQGLHVGHIGVLNTGALTGSPQISVRRSLNGNEVLVGTMSTAPSVGTAVIPIARNFVEANASLMAQVVGTDTAGKVLVAVRGVGMV